MKFIVTLALSVLITVSVGTMIKVSKKQTTSKLVSPIVAGAYTTKEPTTIDDSTHSSIFGWQVFVNNYYGYKIKHPSDVSIKNKRNGDISLQKTKAINLSITQKEISANETVNTIVEKAIDSRRNELKDRYNLLNSITPIALGSVTAQTYSSSENGENITYYYVPQEDKKYLLVINQTPNRDSADFLTSVDMVYSIELIP